MGTLIFKVYSEVGGKFDPTPWDEISKATPCQYDSIQCEYPYRPWWQKFLGRFSWYWSWYERDAWPRMPGWLGTKPKLSEFWKNYLADPKASEPYERGI